MKHCCLLLTYLLLYLLSLSDGLDGKILVFDHLCVFLTLCVTLLDCIHFPLWTLIVSFVWFWDSPWYLVSTSGWYHHVRCILYTNDVTLGTLWRILPGSVGIACSPMLPVSCGGIGCEPVSSICHSSSWWGCEYSTFYWQNYTVNFAVTSVFELCYWLAGCVSRASRRCSGYLCRWVLWHGWLTLLCDVLSWRVLLSIVL